MDSEWRIVYIDMGLAKNGGRAFTAFHRSPVSASLLLPVEVDSNKATEPFSDHAVTHSIASRHPQRESVWRLVLAASDWLDRDGISSARRD